MNDAARACCVYCVIEAGDGLDLEGVRGIDPAFPVTVLRGDGLDAVISEVSLDEFGEDALRRNFEDLGWLERTARSHQAVLDHVLASRSLVPLRLCTIFADEASVRQMLERERPTLAAALERVRDRAEWSVKVLADPDAIRAAARERAGAGAPGEASGGRAYFERKRLDRTAQEQAHAIADSAAGEIHRELERHAVATTMLPPQDRRLSGHTGEMVLNGAYLVDRAHAARFTEVAEGLAGRYAAVGIGLDLSGPWAPYSFTAVGGGE
jgi:hypothetical protein